MNRQASDAFVGRLARWLVPVVALVAIWFTLQGGNTIVALLLMGYSFVTQLFPALIASLMQKNRATKQGAMGGIIAGVAVVVVTTTMHLSIGQMFPFLPDAAKDVNIGFLALALNIIVFVVVSALTQPHVASGAAHETDGALR